jgi:hypothetical protein
VAEVDTNLDEEIEEFSKTHYQVRTINDEVFNIPKVGWVVESQVLKSIGRLIKKLPKDLIAKPETDKKSKKSELDYFNISGDNIFDIIGIICEEAPDEITNMVALIIKRDTDWVGENLDLEGIVGILSPFFLERRLRILRTFKQMNEKKTKNSTGG